jgi:ABC-type proline/glycine betaine transport system permease subunit
MIEQISFPLAAIPTDVGGTNTFKFILIGAIIALVLALLYYFFIHLPEKANEANIENG